MNVCNQKQSRFSEYIDGRLSDSERQDLTRHLGDCPQCALEFRRFRAAHEALLVLAEPLQGRPVLSAVRARIRQDEQRSRRARWIWVPAPVLAACGLAAVVVFGLQGRQTDVAGVARPASPASHPAVSGGDQGAGQRIALAPEAAPEAAVPAARTDAAVKEYARVISPASGRPAAMHRKASRTLAAMPVPSPASASPAVSRTANVEDRVAAAVGKEPAQPRIMVVAYRPSANYCASLENAETGESIAEVSVNSTYAADGSVRRANVVLHFPPVRKAAGSNGYQDDPSSKTESSRGSAWSADII